MIEHFESPTCFLTYKGERNPSFSAICNVLSMLLHLPTVGLYQKQTSKATIFLCDSWDQGTVYDKWVSASSSIFHLSMTHLCPELVRILPSDALISRFRTDFTPFGQ